MKGLPLMRVILSLKCTIILFYLDHMSRKSKPTFLAWNKCCHNMDTCFNVHSI